MMISLQNTAGKAVMSQVSEYYETMLEKLSCNFQGKGSLELFHGSLPRL